MAQAKAELFSPSLWGRAELNMPEEHDTKCQDEGRNYTEPGLEVRKENSGSLSPPLMSRTIAA